jgi:glutathione synthetase
MLHCNNHPASLLILFLSQIFVSHSLMNDLPLDALAVSANAFAAANGIQVEKKREDDNNKSYFECAPISLLPNAYPQQAFAQAQRLAPSFNLLVDRISRNGDFLCDTLGGGVSEADPYTAKLLQLYRDIYLDTNTNDNDNDSTNKKKNQFALDADRLGILRSDYMLHQGQIKQVELNTIASSFAALSTKVAELHSFLIQRFASEQDAMQDFLKTNQKAIGAGVSTTDADAAAFTEGVPTNPALDRLPYAMHVTVERYKERFGSSTTSTSKSAVAVLFVVQEGESNTVDQRMLEFKLFHDYQIPVVRRSLQQLHTQLRCDDTTGALFVQDQEIALVYFRAGYAPTDYPDGDDGIEWQARARLETSRATKCPCLGYHLAGTKKVQQELARPDVLEKFFPDDPDACQDMRQAFAGLYSLGEDATTEDLAAVKDVLGGGQARYVMKPQREGGGYNYYGEQLFEKLQKNVGQDTEDTAEVTLNKQLGEFILMERLFPPQQKAVLLRSGRVEGTGDSISELGCFGCVVVSHDGTDVVHNEYAGFLLRTKFANVDEGGVASGFATLSSPYLC